MIFLKTALVVGRAGAGVVAGAQFALSKFRDSEGGGKGFLRSKYNNQIFLIERSKNRDSARVGGIQAKIAAYDRRKSHGRPNLLNIKRLDFISDIFISNLSPI